VKRWIIATGVTAAVVIFLVVYVFVPPSSSCMGFLCFSYDLYTECEVRCGILSNRYSSAEQVLAAARVSDYCTNNLNCLELLGRCKVALVNGTQITVGCD
jgi:hypothetical protein